MDAGPSRAQLLCGDPAAFVGQRFRIPIDLTSSRTSLSTLALCPSQDGGPVRCCNAVTVRFWLPCSAPTLELVAATGLQLSPSDFGPYEPVVSRGTDAGTFTLACRGCEAGLSCSPADPATVRAVWGAVELRPGASYVFSVDELEK